MKFGVVGHGSIGSRHAENLRMLGHTPLIYDPKEMEPSVKREKHLYDQCGAVVIATPSPYHEGCIRACVERGCHMLIEKPISTSHGMLQSLLNQAEEKKLVVMMGNNLRFHPCVQQAKQCIDNEAFGTPLWASFTCGQQSSKPLYLSDGVILNTGAHEVDMALHLLGPGHVEHARAQTLFDHDRVAEFWMLHDSGCWSSFHLDFVTPDPIREAWIVGAADKIGIDLINRNISFGNEVSRCGGSYDDDYVLEMKAFIDRIEGKETLGATGMNGLETLDVLLAARRKAGL